MIGKLAFLKDPFLDPLVSRGGLTSSSRRALAALGVPFSTLDIFDNVLPVEISQYLALPDKPKRKKKRKRKNRGEKSMKKKPNKKSGQDRYIQIIKLAERVLNAKKKRQEKEALYDLLLKSGAMVPLGVADEEARPKRKKERSMLKILLPLLLLAGLGGGGYFLYQNRDALKRFLGLDKEVPPPEDKILSEEELKQMAEEAARKIFSEAQKKFPPPPPDLIF